jgi:hypothetical protein
MFRGGPQCSACAVHQRGRIRPASKQKTPVVEHKELSSRGVVFQTYTPNLQRFRVLCNLALPFSVCLAPGEVLSDEEKPPGMRALAVARPPTRHSCGQPRSAFARVHAACAGREFRRISRIVSVGFGRLRSADGGSGAPVGPGSGCGAVAGRETSVKL